MALKRLRNVYFYRVLVFWRDRVGLLYTRKTNNDIKYKNHKIIRRKIIIIIISHLSISRRQSSDRSVSIGSVPSVAVVICLSFSVYRKYDSRPGSLAMHFSIHSGLYNRIQQTVFLQNTANPIHIRRFITLSHSGLLSDLALFRSLFPRSKFILNVFLEGRVSNVICY